MNLRVYVFREKAGIKETMKQLNDELNKQKQENSDQRNSMREISQKFEDQKRYSLSISKGMDVDLNENVLNSLNNYMEGSGSATIK